MSGRLPGILPVRVEGVDAGRTPYGLALSDLPQPLSRPRQGWAGRRHRRHEVIDDRCEGAGEPERLAPSVDDRGERCNGAVGLVRRPSFHRGEQGRAECPDIATWTARSAARPLRGDVGRRAEKNTGPGQRRIPGRQRDAEVGQPRASVGTDQYVGGLHVTVHDAAAVRGFQGVAEADADPGDPLAGQRPGAADDVRQRRTVHQFHDDPRAVVGIEHVEDRHEARMV